MVQLHVAVEHTLECNCLFDIQYTLLLVGTLVTMDRTSLDGQFETSGLESFFCWEPTQLHYIFFSSVMFDYKGDMYLNEFVSYVLLSVAVSSASS